MLTYSFTFADDVVKTVIADLKNAPRKLQQAAATRIKAIVERDIQPLRNEPPQSSLPFIWSRNPAAQARARRWYFANKVPKGKRKKGARYKRTHGLAQGWTVDVNAFRASLLIAVSNPAVKAVKWAESIFQTPSHQASGWAQYEDVLLKAEVHAEDALITTWYDTLLGDN